MQRERGRAQGRNRARSNKGHAAHGRKRSAGRRNTAALAMDPMQAGYGTPAEAELDHVLHTARQGDGKKRRLPVIFWIALVVFIISSVFLAKTLIERHQGRQSYTQLIDQINEAAPESSTAPVEGESFVITQAALDLLYETNNDFIGWISIPGTRVHYPIVQSGDNDYYLNITFKGEWNGCGCLFVDYNNNKLFTDPNTVVYGHNMLDGSMFHDLLNYLNADYWADHRNFTITLRDGTILEYEVFSAYQVDASAPYRTIYPADPISYFNGLRDSSAQRQDVSFGPESRIVTFSTCPNYNSEQYRIAVHAIQVGTSHVEE